MSCTTRYESLLASSNCTRRRTSTRKPGGVRSDKIVHVTIAPGPSAHSSVNTNTADILRSWRISWTFSCTANACLHTLKSGESLSLRVISRSSCSRSRSAPESATQRSFLRLQPAFPQSTRGRQSKIVILRPSDCITAAHSSCISCTVSLQPDHPQYDGGKYRMLARSYASPPSATFCLRPSAEFDCVSTKSPG